jgi:hypothetical protein
LSSFKGDPAVSAINTICAPQGKSSYHFIISRTGNITQHVPLNLAAWDAGTNNSGGDIDNRHSTLRHVRERRTNNNWFSVSVCMAVCDDEIPNATMLNAANQLISWINAQLNDLIRFIVGHDSITPRTRANCPGKQFPWNRITLRGIAARNNDTDLKALAASAPTPAPQPTPARPALQFKEGDIVQFTGGGVYRSSEASIPVHSRGRSRCRITQPTNGNRNPYHLVSTDNGGVHGWVVPSDVTAVGNATPAPTPAAPSGNIVAGSRVRVRNGAKLFNGGNVSSFVYQDTWIVHERKGDRVVINRNLSGRNAIMTAFRVSDLILV